MTIQDKAYQLMTIKVDLLEVTLGERTNVETISKKKLHFLTKCGFVIQTIKFKQEILMYL
jgi:hypothetical protein